MKTLLTRLLAAATVTTALVAPAHAAFPDRPVKIIIGFPAGGPLDAHGRLLADKLQAALGQPVIIDYKAGAGGTIGAEFVAKSPADGYTLMLANTGVMVINPAVYPKLGYQTLKDFVPIARTAQQPLALVVHPSVPAKTVPELVALAQKSPGRLNYASAGNGGSSHLVPEMFKQATGTFIVHIPYRGSAPAMTDLIAGQVQMMAESIPLAAQYVKQGKLRALAITGRERNAALPEVPTFAEVGVKGMEVVGFYGILAPAGTPKDVVAKLADAFRQVLTNPELQKTMTAQGADPAFLDSEQFGRYLAAELPRWKQAVDRSGTKLD
ncbi:Bug family tripartite tricarboxylate transporter substrate binding protein [Aquabacterium humicola]|uniref:Bug family tripartite tricarboxylate transporter substrate binding protein n=1 Tax=Aquabacterium humicola TaxID=3237377 RepID=UPI0025435D26|nr:tripartite tricarboxylate transporter substrate binding protein [Rubrivivax pictus]